MVKINIGLNVVKAIFPLGVIIIIIIVDIKKENILKYENIKKSSIDRTDFPAVPTEEIVEFEEAVMFTLLSLALA
jgi:hypothetical protein